MKLIQNFLTNNECYKKNVTMTPKGGMLHSTGANNPNLRRYVQPNIEGIGENKNGNHWNQYRPSGRQVCVHGFIGKLENGEIATVQTLPWNMRGWHAGKSGGNDSYIGVEICEDGLSDPDYFNKVYQEAVELFADLAKQFNWNPLTDIICHCEGYKKGLASNHADVMHWFPKHGKSMDTFRADVQNKLNESNTPAAAPEVPQPAMSYLVTITCDVLNVREGAGTNYKVATSVKRGEVYTIVDEQMNGETKWGKLKSGAGWISLKYTSANTSAPKPAAKKMTVGSKVKIKSSATKYCSGQKIPNSVKRKTYTVMQIGTTKYPNGVLLKEIMSWVNKSDLQF